MASSIASKQTLISIAAGVRTSTLEGILRKKVAVVRVMPNTPALIGQGMAVVSRGRYAKKSHEQTALKLFRSVGKAIALPENMIDAVTAISGSGPAYVFFLIEALAAAGQKAGLSRAIALTLALETAAGAARMAVLSKDEPKLLREKVTSKGGTTQAALRVLESKGFKKIMAQAVLAAKKRSGQLSRLS
jgi:pyrroline-5-carboxylate reductase